jgi:hypothetical protein
MKNAAIIRYAYTPITILTQLIEIVFHRPFLNINMEYINFIIFLNFL